MIEELAKQTIERGSARSKMVATAESCTGGLIAGALTEIAGSSAVFDRGFVTYSNEAKAQMLGVPIEHTENPGAVSDLVAREMVSGALENSRAHVAVAVTGIAGPDGGSPEKPVGLVYIAAQSRDGIAEVQECRFAEEGADSRQEIRRRTVETALEMLLRQIG